MKDGLVAVTGAGGFIGGAVVAEFRRQGYRKIRAVDIVLADARMKEAASLFKHWHVARAPVRSRHLHPSVGRHAVGSWAVRSGWRKSG